MKKTAKKGRKLFAWVLIVCLLSVICTPINSSATSKMKLDKTKVTLRVGESTKLKVKGATKTVKWSSSEKKVATVTQKGVVTAKKVGTAKIYAKVSGKKFTCKVTVKPAMSLNKKSVTLKKGASTTLKVKNASGTVKWRTGNKKVATVTNKGAVKAVGVGTTTISATVSKKTLKCKVTVSDSTKVITPTPSVMPKITPTVEPTKVPEVTPTVEPTKMPEVTPTVEPTKMLEVTPTVEPTKIPEATPTVEPTNQVSPTPVDITPSEPTIGNIIVSTETKEGGDFVIGVSTQKIMINTDADTSNAKLEIVNESKEAVFTKEYDFLAKDNETILNWNGKNDSGAYVESGMYQVVITVGKVTKTSEFFRAIAQEQAGYLTVSVVDIAGNSLPGAEIQATCVEGSQYSGLSDESGNLQGNYLAGEYECAVELNGYDQTTGTFTLNPEERNKVTIVMLSSDISIKESGVHDGIVWKLTTDGDLILTGSYTGTEDGQEISFADAPWSDYKSRVCNAYVDVENLTSLRDMFYGYTGLEYVSFGLHMNKGTVVTMRSAFDSATFLTSVDLTNLNTKNVTSMFLTFGSCSALKSVDVSGFDVTNLETIEGMFTACKNLEIIDLSAWGNNRIKNMAGAFYSSSSLKTVNLDNVITSEAITLESMFGHCSSLTSVSCKGIDTSNVSSMKLMFERCTSLRNINLSSWNLSKVEDMEGTFSFCHSLQSLNLSGLDLSSVKTMEAMLYECKALTDLDLTEVNTENVQNMSKMFGYCTSLKTVNLADFDTQSATAMDYMFEVCTSLTELKLNNFETSNVTNMECMFTQCSGLTSLNLASFDTSNVTNMKGVFHKCYALTNVNVGSFDTSKVTDMSGMFEQCKALKTVDVSSFNTENVVTMEYMFYMCESLETLDASDFVTPKLKNCGAMFANDTNLKRVFLNNFGNSGAYMGVMFQDCSSMEVIMAGSNWSPATGSLMMFNGCGVSGVTYE